MQPILMQLQEAIRKPSTKTNSYSYQVTNSFSAALKSLGAFLVIQNHVNSRCITQFKTICDSSDNSNHWLTKSYQLEQFQQQWLEASFEPKFTGI